MLAENVIFEKGTNFSSVGKVCQALDCQVAGSFILLMKLMLNVATTSFAPFPSFILCISIFCSFLFPWLRQHNRG